MQVNGVEIARRDVKIDVGARDVFQALRKEIFHKLKLPAYEREIPYIKGKKIVIDEEFHTSHSYFETKVIAENPSDDQIDAIKAFEKVSALMSKLEIY